MLESLMIWILNGMLWLLLDPQGNTAFVCGWIVSVAILLAINYHCSRGERDDSSAL